MSEAEVEVEVIRIPESEGVEQPGLEQADQITRRIKPREPLLVQIYLCSNVRCKATSRVRLWQDERVPKVLICWKCRAGLGVASVDKMITENRGMFPLGNPVPEEE